MHGPPNILKNNWHITYNVWSAAIQATRIFHCQRGPCIHNLSWSPRKRNIWAKNQMTGAVIRSFCLCRCTELRMFGEGNYTQQLRYGLERRHTDASYLWRNTNRNFGNTVWRSIRYFWLSHRNGRNSDPNKRPLTVPVHTLVAKRFAHHAFLFHAIFHKPTEHTFTNKWWKTGIVIAFFVGS